MGRKCLAIPDSTMSVLGCIHLRRQPLKIHEYPNVCHMFAQHAEATQIFPFTKTWRHQGLIEASSEPTGLTENNGSFAPAAPVHGT